MDDPDDSGQHGSMPIPELPGHRHSLGVVVACYAPERLEDVARVLDSIARQTAPVDDVVVVVQRSCELRESVRRLLTRMPGLKCTVLFQATGSGVSHARNEGLEALGSDIIAFVDDDAVLADDWAAATRELYSHRPDAIGVAGAILPLWDSPAMAWFPRELYWMLSCTYWTAVSPTPVRNGYGANMSFRREAFDAGRRFNESIGISGWGVAGWRGVGGEEPELALRVTKATGRLILFGPDIRAWHRVRAHRLGLRNLARRAYWEGRFKSALSGAEAAGSGVLTTEWSLVRQVLRAHVGRMRLLGRHPVTALRQEAMVLFVVAAVGLGFVVGKLRRHYPAPTGRRPGIKGDTT